MNERDEHGGRKIIHVDMDAFFAAVECLDHPSLRGKPLVVGGDPKSRAVVCSASYEARKFGVRAAMSCAQAARLCPKAVFVSPNIPRYVEVSKELRKIFLSVTPLVEPLSLDEAYLDVTENLLKEPLARKVAQHIKDRIRDELHLTASAGVGPNTFIAKIASDMKKPDGLVVIPPAKVAEFVSALPIEKLWGVGPVTAEKLGAAGIKTTADVRKRSPQDMERMLGSFGRFIWDLAHGRDDRLVETDHQAKSCGSETTFERDVLDLSVLEKTISTQAHDVAAELRKLKRPGKTVVLKVRYDDFATITRSRSILGRTDRSERIAAVAQRLLVENTEAGTRPIRLIGVSVSGLWDGIKPEQLVLPFPPPWEY